MTEIQKQQDPDYLCGECNSIKHEYNYLRNEQFSECKEEEIECYYCLKKYNDHQQAEILFMGKPSCLNCKHNDAALKNNNYQYLSKNILNTPKDIQGIQHKKGFSGQFLSSGGNVQIQQAQIITPRGNRTQTSQFKIQTSSENQFSNVKNNMQSPEVDLNRQPPIQLQLPEKQRRVTLSPSPYLVQPQKPNNELDLIQEQQQVQERSETKIILPQNISPSKSHHHRSQTLQTMMINSNITLMNKQQQLQKDMSNLVDYKTYNENQLQQNQQKEDNNNINIQPVIKSSVKEQRVLKLLQEYKEQGTKYLQKKCIFKYSDYRQKGLVSQKFKEKCDKKSNLIILIQCNSGLLFGAFISEPFDKKQKQTIVDKLSILFSVFGGGSEPQFYPVNNNKIVMDFESGIQIGKPESLVINFDQLNQSKCTYSMSYESPIGGIEEQFNIQWNTSWTNMVQDIYVFKM